jgi:hypothetical protein
VKPSVTVVGFADSLVSNYRLYANDVLIKTSNLADFSGLDYTINKSQSVNFKIVADFSNSIPAGSTYRIVIPTLT